MKKSIAFLFLFVITFAAKAQHKSGYYINWNADHTERAVKPTIPVSETDAKLVGCYYVKFNNEGKFISASYFFGGKPSPHSNFGAHRIVRIYQKGKFTERFKNAQGQQVTNSSKVFEQVYSLNAKGFWTKRETFDKKGKKLEIRGVATLKLKRDAQNRGILETQYNLKGELVPDINGFDYPYFAFSKDGMALYRQNRDKNGKMVNGKKGYAMVRFWFDENGNFINEDFRSADGKLFTNRAGYAQINFRELNKYGKPRRVYFMDAQGRPRKGKTFAVITYRPNMTRESVTYYNERGEKTEDKRGIASSVFKYDARGKYLSRENYNLAGKKVK